MLRTKIRLFPDPLSNLNGAFTLTNKAGGAVKFTNPNRNNTSDVVGTAKATNISHNDQTNYTQFLNDWNLKDSKLKSMIDTCVKNNQDIYLYKDKAGNFILVKDNPTDKAGNGKLDFRDQVYYFNPDGTLIDPAKNGDKQYHHTSIGVENSGKEYDFNNSAEMQDALDLIAKNYFQE